MKRGRGLDMADLVRRAKRALGSEKRNSWASGGGGDSSSGGGFGGNTEDAEEELGHYQPRRSTYMSGVFFGAADEMRPPEPDHLAQDAPPAAGVLTGLESLTKIEMACGPDDPSKCVLCSHPGEGKRAPMYASEMQRIYSFIRENRLTMPLLQLAQQALEYYNVLRARAIERYGDGPQCPLPAQTLQQFAYHILGDHNISSSLWLPLRLQQLGEIASVLARKCMFAEKDGQIQISKDNWAAYERVVKLELVLRRVNPEKIAFWDKGMQIDYRKASQIMATHGKNLIGSLRDRGTGAH